MHLNATKWHGPWWLKIYFLRDKVEVGTVYQCTAHLQFGSSVGHNVFAYDASLTASSARTELKASIYINKWLLGIVGNGMLAHKASLTVRLAWTFEVKQELSWYSLHPTYGGFVPAAAACPAPSPSSCFLSPLWADLSIQLKAKAKTKILKINIE